MSNGYISERDLRFLLYDVHQAGDLVRLPYYEDHDLDSFKMVLDAAFKFSDGILRPISVEMDRFPTELVDGRVKVLPAVREMIRAFGEGGWLGAGLPFEDDGQQLPRLVETACALVFNSANFPATAYSLLTGAAVRMIHHFASDSLKEAYLPFMLSGQWQGTMAMTEPQAGSSVGDVATRARPTEDGYYLIEGQKIFISAGDHDGVDNVIHLMLARLADAPPGIKGISLFLVPKFRPENGGLATNDVTTAGVFHKLGYRGCPIVQLSMGEQGDCRGWLLGEPHKGIQYMFHMMNEARIGVGVQAAGVASAAYYASLDYARERPQGRPLTDKDPQTPQINIIEHPDVRRMLLFQRAVVEGSMSLLLQTARYDDLARQGPEEERERYGLLLDILTPVAKSYPSEMGIPSISTGLQILGGYGYCDEYPLEQYYRDARIHPIHEGTTGIQAMDLLGRKSVMKNGAAVEAFIAEVEAAVEAGRALQETASYAERLQSALELTREVLSAKMSWAVKGRVNLFLADAVLYLDLFSLTVIAWQWLLQGIVAVQKGKEASGEGESNYLAGKLLTMKYFFHYELPKTRGLAARLLEDDALTVDASSEMFTD